MPRKAMLFRIAGGVLVLLTGVALVAYWISWRSRRTPRAALQGARGELCGYRFGRGGSRLFLYLHGGPGYNAFDFSAFTAPLLVRAGEVVAFDQRGSGCSPRGRSSREFDLASQLDDIDRIVQEEARGRPVVLIGHSYGGLLAVEYVVRRRQVSALVLVDAPLNLTDAIRRLVEICRQRVAERGNAEAAEALGHAVTLRSLDEQVRALTTWAPACPGEVLVPPNTHPTEQQVLEMAKRAGYTDDDTVNDGLLFEAAMDSADRDLRLSPYELASVSVPVLEIVGDLDPYFPPGARSELPHARVVRIAGVGHHAYREAPKTFAEEVVRFVEEHVPTR
ncbi:alpha/beta hydrolase [Sorangium sp. So ce367]|uniref:alpha/beta hydrolase n=1 Tax=Sorangium sp. So ce367 TaxID=3133305 RepID=UPI003F62DD60